MLRTALIPVMAPWNAITVARAGRAALTGYALALGAASVAEAAYGPRTVIGTDYQQTSFTRSPDGINEGSCQDTTQCFVLFQRAPQRRALVIQHVSCRMTVLTGELIVTTLATRRGQTFTLRDTSLLAEKMSDQGWVVDRPVKHLIKPGERPQVLLRTSAPDSIFGLSCNISGRLVEP